MSKLFRLQDNAPPYCIEQSRDFQLFCRIFDSITNSIRFDTKSMLSTLDASKSNDRMLELYATRVGFSSSVDIDANVLRYILAAFPYIIKNKGTKVGIEQCIYTILKAENSTEPPFVDIINRVYDPDTDIYNDSESYIVNIYTPIRLFNEAALRELLKYIIPAGYKYNIILYNSTPAEPLHQINTSDFITTIVGPRYIVSSGIRGSNGIGSNYYPDVPKYNTDTITNEEKRLINAFDMTEIIGSNNYDLTIKNPNGADIPITDIKQSSVEDKPIE